MKTLRVARNITALLIFAMALLGATRPATGASGISKGCVGFKNDYNCSYDAAFNCHTTKCDPGGAMFKYGLL